MNTYYIFFRTLFNGFSINRHAKYPPAIQDNITKPRKPLFLMTGTKTSFNFITHSRIKTCDKYNAKLKFDKTIIPFPILS